MPDSSIVTNGLACISPVLMNHEMLCASHQTYCSHINHIQSCHRGRSSRIFFHRNFHQKFCTLITSAVLTPHGVQSSGCQVNQSYVHIVTLRPMYNQLNFHMMRITVCQTREVESVVKDGKIHQHMNFVLTLTTLLESLQCYRGGQQNS